MEPITRQEKFLNSIATGDSAELEPITREEMYLSAIAGSTESKPEKPITRKEMFYEKILESGGVGGGGDGTAKPEQTKTIEVTENGTYKITPDSGKVLSSATAKVNVPERYNEGYNEGFAEGKNQGLSEGYSSGFGAGVNSVKLQEKTATENGDVLPDEGFNGMSKVTVAIPTGSGKEEQEKSITITKNGTTEVTPDEGKTLSKVTVTASVVDSEVGKPYIDTSKMTSFADFFKNNPTLVEDVDKIDTSNGTSFAAMFYSCSSLKTIPLLDTSSGTNFTSMFHSCSSLKTIPSLDTSSGTNFTSMFHNCQNLETIPSLDTSNGTSFAAMFYNCQNLETIPLLDTSNGTSFASMFNNCLRLESVSLTTAKSDFSTNSFQNCTALTNLTIGEGWAASIYLTYSNNLTVESLHGMIENFADLTGSTAKTFSVGATNLAKIDEEHIAMLQAKNWNYS